MDLISRLKDIKAATVSYITAIVLFILLGLFKRFVVQISRVITSRILIGCR